MTSGIYSITCRDWIYYGQSWDMWRRWRTHCQKLTLGKHTNSILQRLHDKYGLDEIKFSIVEVCAHEDLNRLEIAYLSNPPLKLMNLQEGGQSGCAGRIWTPEARLHASQAKSGANHPLYGKPRTDEEKLKISKGLTGHVRPPETVERMRQANLGSKNPMYGRIPWNKKNKEASR